ncbi:hypothetical protein SBOR_5765 [Sclerotinia borealis F-4128]|uniref:Uncharacterized protein n=1 Tax=Sclerotinia borealis (strain F-4128) TaxID=1432307 RepID=W9CGG8_SCLBF|nr:hypothetical protein SBOR_5765 [Sclerotinia borealis F-4128]
MNIILDLDQNDYLYNLTSETDVFGELIDCFRICMEDENAYAGNGMGIYDNQDPLPVFREFLDLAEKRERILPTWWNQEKRGLRERMAGSDAWYNINCAVGKSDIVEHYKEGMKPAKLRILGEKIYGRGFTM